MESPSPIVELLQASIDEENESYLRLLVDGRYIKYLTIEPGLYRDEDMAFGPALPSLLPTFPHGPWNDGLISKHPETGNPHFARTTKTSFPGLKHLWNTTFIDHLDLKLGDKLTSGVYKATSCHFDSTAVVKFARFQWEVEFVENENIAYSWLKGRGVGPEFIGYMTEEGRVIGFVVEYIADARHAAIDDLKECQEALLELHQLGIIHGDINRHNFLISNGKATLVDFDSARRCGDRKAMDDEYRGLSRSL